MQRRSFVVGCACGIGTALAGCLGDEDETPEAGEGESQAGNDVEDAIRNAVGEANSVAIGLAVAREDADGPGEIDVDGDELGSALADARASLDEAAELEAADEYEAELAAAGAYVDVVDGLLSATLDLVAVASDLEALEAALDDENYDGASEQLSAVLPQVQSASDATADAEGWLQNLDQEAISAYGAQTDRLADGLAELSNLATGADYLTSGYDELLTGRERLEDGQSERESRNYDAAETEFETAGDRFADASAEFGTGRTGAPEELAGEFDAATCRSGHLEDAAEHFAAAASAADSGDAATASSELDDGEAALDDAANC